MTQLSHADHSVSPPRITFPRAYNAAADLVERHMASGRGNEIAFIDDAGPCSYASLAQRVNRCANAWRRLGLRIEDRAVLLHDSVVRLVSVVLALQCLLLLRARIAIP